MSLIDKDKLDRIKHTIKNNRKHDNNETNHNLVSLINQLRLLNYHEPIAKNKVLIDNTD